MPLYATTIKGTKEECKAEYDESLSPEARSACVKGNIHTLKELLKGDNSTETWDEVFYLAALHDHPELVTLAADKIDLPSCMHSMGLAAMIEATQRGHVSTVKCLLELGLDVEAATAQGYTPLRFAFDNRQDEVIALLASYNADINSVDSCHNSILHSVASKGYADMVLLALHMGAASNVLNDRDETPMEVSKAPEICRNILEFHAGYLYNVNPLSPEGLKKGDDLPEEERPLAPSPFRTLPPGPAAHLFWTAMGVGKDNYIFENFGVYPFDRLKDTERVVVLTQVAQVMAGYKSSNSIQCNLLNESALFAVFSFMKARVQEELSQNHHRDKNNESQGTFIWRRRVLEAYEQVYNTLGSLAGLSIECWQHCVWNTIINLLARSLFGQLCFWQKKRMFMCPNMLERQTFITRARLPADYFICQLPSTEPIAVQLTFKKLISMSKNMHSDKPVRTTSCFCQDCVAELEVPLAFKLQFLEEAADEKQTLINLRKQRQSNLQQSKKEHKKKGNNCQKNNHTDHHDNNSNNNDGMLAEEQQKQMHAILFGPPQEQRALHRFWANTRLEQKWALTEMTLSDLTKLVSATKHWEVLRAAQGSYVKYAWEADFLEIADGYVAIQDAIFEEKGSEATLDAMLACAQLVHDNRIPDYTQDDLSIDKWDHKGRKVLEYMVMAEFGRKITKRYLTHRQESLAEQVAFELEMELLKEEQAEKGKKKKKKKKKKKNNNNMNNHIDNHSKQINPTNDNSRDSSSNLPGDKNGDTKKTDSATVSLSSTTAAVPIDKKKNNAKGKDLSTGTVPTDETVAINNTATATSIGNKGGKKESSDKSSSSRKNSNTTKNKQGSNNNPSQINPEIMQRLQENKKASHIVEADDSDDEYLMLSSRKGKKNRKKSKAEKKRERLKAEQEEKKRKQREQQQKEEHKQKEKREEQAKQKQQLEKQEERSKRTNDKNQTSSQVATGTVVTKKYASTDRSADTREEDVGSTRKKRKKKKKRVQRATVQTAVNVFAVLEDDNENEDNHQESSSAAGSSSEEEYEEYSGESDPDSNDIDNDMIGADGHIQGGQSQQKESLNQGSATDKSSSWMESIDTVQVDQTAGWNGPNSYGPKPFVSTSWDDNSNPSQSDTNTDWASSTTDSANKETPNHGTVKNAWDMSWASSNNFDSTNVNKVENEYSNSNINPSASSSSSTPKGKNNSFSDHPSLAKYQDGFVFICTHETKKECMRLGLLGAPAKHLRQVQTLRAGTSALFLINVSDRTVHGILEATSDGKNYINPSAWMRPKGTRSPYPAQIAFKLGPTFDPVPESIFRSVFRDGPRIRKLDKTQLQQVIQVFTSRSRPKSRNKRRGSTRTTPPSTPQKPPQTTPSPKKKELSLPIPTNDTAIRPHGRERRRSSTSSNQSLSNRDNSRSRQPTPTGSPSSSLPRAHPHHTQSNKNFVTGRGTTRSTPSSNKPVLNDHWAVSREPIQRAQEHQQTAVYLSASRSADPSPQSRHERERRAHRPLHFTVPHSADPSPHSQSLSATANHSHLRTNQSSSRMGVSSHNSPSSTSSISSAHSSPILGQNGARSHSNTPSPSKSGPGHGPTITFGAPSSSSDAQRYVASARTSEDDRSNSLPAPHHQQQTHSLSRIHPVTHAHAPYSTHPRGSGSSLSPTQRLSAPSQSAPDSLAPSHPFHRMSSNNGIPPADSGNFASSRSHSRYNSVNDDHTHNEPDENSGYNDTMHASPQRHKHQQHHQQSQNYNSHQHQLQSPHHQHQFRTQQHQHTHQLRHHPQQPPHLRQQHQQSLPQRSHRLQHPPSQTSTDNRPGSAAGHRVPPQSHYNSTSPHTSLPPSPNGPHSLGPSPAPSPLRLGRSHRPPMNGSNLSSSSPYPVPDANHVSSSNLHGPPPGLRSNDNRGPSNPTNLSYPPNERHYSTGQQQQQAPDPSVLGSHVHSQPHLRHPDQYQHTASLRQQQHQQHQQYQSRQSLHHQPSYPTHGGRIYNDSMDDPTVQHAGPSAELSLHSRYPSQSTLDDMDHSGLSSFGKTSTQSNNSAPFLHEGQQQQQQQQPFSQRARFAAGASGSNGPGHHQSNQPTTGGRLPPGPSSNSRKTSSNSSSNTLWGHHPTTSLSTHPSTAGNSSWNSSNNNDNNGSVHNNHSTHNHNNHMGVRSHLDPSSHSSSFMDWSHARTSGANSGPSSMRGSPFSGGSNPNTYSNNINDDDDYDPTFDTGDLSQLPLGTFGPDGGFYDPSASSSSSSSSASSSSSSSSSSSDPFSSSQQDRVISGGLGSGMFGSFGLGGSIWSNKQTDWPTGHSASVSTTSSGAPSSSSSSSSSSNTDAPNSTTYW